MGDHVEIIQSMPVVLRAVLAEAENLLDFAKVDDPARDAGLLLRHALGVNRESMVRGDVRFDEKEMKSFAALMAQRMRRLPVSKIIGKRDFWKDTFSVTVDTLDPRADSETLIEAALALRPEKDKILKILDLGTGTGCLLLSLLREFEQAQGVGIDISEKALEVARVNVQALGLTSRTTCMQGNWAQGLSETFDLIVSNPPYIPRGDIAKLMPEVMEYDPLGALDGGEDGLEAYRSLMPQLNKRLSKGGLVLLEIGMGQEKEVAHIAETNGLTLKQHFSDLAGIQRVLAFEPFSMTKIS